ncbi:2-desacetyl-2-hydroxyethyl bacteriochlorophyllide A dehydrogenase [Rhizobium aquaticum]|uniref:2-desacetyl-2-hydroxyethyl bacteriochlorophyllide A dehydrogenase n=1 Tax=Rhizobium aquaticum TaxID=1549636 RepID=A0ABV2J493_9HYPH
MKAILFPAKGVVELTELPDPVPRSGEVLISVKASGICHTDFEILRGNYGDGAFPVVPGHEFVGEIVGLADGVKGLSLGDRVVVDPNLECGHCRACRRQMAHLCEKLGAYGVTKNGGFAEYCAVDAAAVRPIGDMAYDLAALAEPVGCALNGLEPVKHRHIENALVFGAGPMGMIIAELLAKTRGVAVSVADVDADRLAFASAAGHTALHAQSNDLAQARHGFDFVVDATGKAEVVSKLTHFMASGGSALLFGVCKQGVGVTFEPFELFRRQLTVYGTHSLNHNLPDALAAIQRIGPSLSGIVSHRLAIADTVKTFQAGGIRASMKVQMAG